jgi:hypothetical protein
VTEVDKPTQVEPPKSRWGLDPLRPDQWRYKVIGLTALIFGAGSAVVSWRTNGTAQATADSALFLSMLLPPYFIVPRVRVNRAVQGFAGGILGGVIAILSLWGLNFSHYWAARQDLFVAFGGYVIGVAGVSWLSTVVTNWTDKKRAQAETKRAAAGGRTAKGAVKSGEDVGKKPAGRMASAWRAARAMADDPDARKKMSLRQMLKKPEPEKRVRVHRYGRYSKKKK